ncbi:MAG: hypothetical protein RQ856_06435 [Candidatus Izemoplasmatales bacterium]|nr:hypothetical protein [Candidatus Izemoplasmatales bacterium]
MKASATKTGDNWLPVVLHDDGKKETIPGDPLVTKGTAVKYAQLVINERGRF